MQIIDSTPMQVKILQKIREFGCTGSRQLDHGSRSQRTRVSKPGCNFWPNMISAARMSLPCNGVALALSQARYFVPELLRSNLEVLLTSPFTILGREHLMLSFSAGLV